jgi:hypothetical protein
MSILYLIMRLRLPSYDDSAAHALVNALLCISDALWVMVAGKIFGWW